MNTDEIWLDFVTIGHHREYIVVEEMTTKQRRIVLNRGYPLHEDAGSPFSALTSEEKRTLLALAPDWHGTLLQLIDTAKELTK
jgi:hypothetical protein